jgi:hypothetical protein
LYNHRQAWGATGFLGLDARVLREIERVTANTSYDARDESVSWGSYVLAFQRDGGVDVAPTEDPAPPQCEGCGGPLFTLSGRDRKHCDDACKQRAYRRRKTGAMGES